MTSPRGSGAGDIRGAGHLHAGRRRKRSGALGPWTSHLASGLGRSPDHWQDSSSARPLRREWFEPEPEPEPKPEPEPSTSPTPTPSGTPVKLPIVATKVASKSVALKVNGSRVLVKSTRTNAYGTLTFQTLHTK